MNTYGISFNICKEYHKTESLWNHSTTDHTKKKNNWKTKETLERGVVTLETERIKGSNPFVFMMMICKLILIFFLDFVGTIIAYMKTLYFAGQIMRR